MFVARKSPTQTKTRATTTVTPLDRTDQVGSSPTPQERTTSRSRWRAVLQGASSSMVCLLAALSAMLFIPWPAASQSQDAPTWRVATRIIKPFVTEEGGAYSGFSIELWREIADQLKVRTQFVVKPTVRDLLDATRSGEVDVAIAAISITEEREKGWDFSQPMFDAGLGILVADQGDSGAVGHIMEAVLNPAFIPPLIMVILVVIFAGHVVWFFERRRPDGLMSNASYFPNIFECCFWAASTLATQADQMPKSPAARVVAILWMYTAVLFIAFFTASVTSSLTLQSLRSDIQGPNDLPGKRVATVRSSTSAEYLNQRQIQFKDFSNVDEANQALIQGEVDAVVYDSPVLLYFASHEGKGKAQVVGTVFRKESYGILFPTDSPYRKPVNEALLRLKEQGTYDRLVAKYFGDPSKEGK